MIKKNIFSIITALVILYLSFANPENLNKISPVHFRGFDKLVHMGMYFIFTSVILLENKNLLVKVNQFLLITLIPLIFGALVEIFQSLLTVTRTGDIFDLLFNMTGILISVLVFIFLRSKNYIK